MTTKTQEEIKLMTKVCRLAAETLQYAGKYVKPGITTDEIDKIVHDYTLRNEAVPSPLGYHGYPKSVCTSVNEVICHGVPSSLVLKEGDIINVDVTCYKYGFHGDTSATFFVGEVSDEAKRITECAKRAMEKGIEAITPNGMTGDIGFAINKLIQKYGYHAVREIGGHGIGKKFHEDPFVPSYGKKGRGDKLLPWGTITVEPMVNQTASEMIEVSIPGSTVKYYKTGDGCLSAQFEHTVLITDKSYEILTLC